MKRIFTLLLTMLTVLCASASDYNFKVEADGQFIIVTPSAETEKYAFTILDQDAIAVVEKKGLPFETEQQVYDAAKAIEMPFQTMFASVPSNTAEMPDGEYTVVMAAYGTSDNIEKIQVGKVSINVAPEDDVTFAFSCTGETCTITPSNNESEYVAYVISPDYIKTLQVPETLEPLTSIGLFVYGQASALKIGEARTGKSELTTADSLEEIKLNDRCVVVAFGVKTFMKSFKDGDKEVYSNSTPFSYFIWNVGETSSSIDTLETPASSMGKVFKDGKFIINGEVLIDGTKIK